MNRALFLDRDGIINIDRGTYTWRQEDFILMPGILDLCETAVAQGYRLIVITNQGGIARGLYGHKDVESLHHYMASLFIKKSISFDAIYYCPHHQDFTGRCFCRKPGSMMLERAIARFGISAPHSYMLGDRQRDLDAGKYVGCQTVYIGEIDKEIKADFAFRELSDMRQHLVKGFGKLTS